MARNQTSSFPPLWRVALAFLLAPFAGFWAYTLVGGLAEGRSAASYLPPSPFDPVLIFAYAPALLFGLPVYLVLRGRVSPSWLNCALTGSAVAALGLLITVLVFGSPFTWGLAIAFVVVAVAGAVGGLLFWIIAAANLRSRS